MGRRQRARGRRKETSADRKYGLVNQGATCYLNSVLQVLFMTREFREAVKGRQAESEYIDPHLSALFNNLTKGISQTCDITKKLGIHRVHEQRDAAESFEKILHHTSSEASQIFEGKLMHKNQCSNCGAETETGGPVWILPLALKNSGNGDYSVVDGIQMFFRVQDVVGDDQMYCNHCDAKADATVRHVMKHHPEVLVLLLKRFQFDYKYMVHVKISCGVDVPCTLQLPQGETYELYGFVDHFGGLTGGHYTATIRCQDDETWYNFNDTRVFELPNQQVDNIKSSTAYLLFYRKKNVNAAGTQDTRMLPNNGSFQSDTSHKQNNAITRRRKEDEEAAGSALYIVENEKSIVEDRGDTETKTEDEQQAEGHENERQEHGANDHKSIKSRKRTKKNRNKVKHQGKETLDNVGEGRSEDHADQGDIEVNEESRTHAGGKKKAECTRHEQQREENRDSTEDKGQTTSDSIKICEVIQESRSGQNSGLQRSSVKKKKNVKQKELVASNNEQTRDEREGKREIGGNLNADSVAKREANRDVRGDRQRAREDACIRRRETSGSHHVDKAQELPEGGICRKDVKGQSKAGEKDARDRDRIKEVDPAQRTRAGGHSGEVEVVETAADEGRDERTKRNPLMQRLLDFLCSCLRRKRSDQKK